MEINENIEFIEKLNSLPLKETEKEIFNKRFGIGEENSFTVEEIMNIYKIKKEEVWRIEAKVFRLLRHPHRSRKLKEFLDIEDEEKEQSFNKLNEEIIAGRKYTEKEINVILKKYCGLKDYVSLRKELLKNGFLNRTSNCSEYWKVIEEKNSCKMHNGV